MNAIKVCFKHKSKMEGKIETPGDLVHGAQTLYFCLECEHENKVRDYREECARVDAIPHPAEQMKAFSREIIDFAAALELVRMTWPKR